MSKRILLVEDEALIAMSEAQMLEKHGYEVVTAHSGEKAIEAVDSDPDISLILMDIDLGRGMDGTEVAQRILEKHDLPIAFLSSHTEPEVVEKTEGITSYGYIVKNSGQTVLLASIRMAFRLFDARMKEKKKEAKLVQSEELMRYIIKYDPNAIAVYDTKLRYIAVSDRYLHDYKVKADSILGTHHYEAFPEIPQRWKAIHQRVLKGETVRNDDDWFERPDGSITYNRWECRPWYTADGSVGGMITYTEVTTERKLAQEALEAGRNLLNASQKIARVGGWEWDVATDTVTWSEELYNITGLDPSFPPPQFNDDHHKIYTKESWQKLSRAVERTLKTGESYEIYAQIVRPDGECRDVYIYGGSNFDNDGSISGLFGIVQDITDKKQREKQLSESEEDLRITLNSIGDAVISTDTEGSIIRMNPVAEALCGWGTSEAKGRALQEVFHIVRSDTGEEVENPVGKVLETGHIVGLANHTMLISRDGTQYQIADSAAPIRDDDGNTTGVVLVFRDVTEEYRVAQALADSERDMARAQVMAQLGSWRFDLDSGVVTASDQARRIYGVAEGELTIEYVQSLVLPEYRTKLDAALTALVENGTPYDIEFQMRRSSDNAVRTIHSVAEYDARHHWVVGTLQDITERTRAEIALRENDKTAHQFFSESAAGAFFMMLDEPIEWNDSVDKEHVLDYVFDHQRITQINRAMLDQYQAREEDFLGKTPNELFAHDVEHGRSLWRKMLDQGYLSIDSDERRFDGSQLWIVGSYRCMYDEQGRITGHFGTQHDITELKRAEEALKAKNSLLERVFDNNIDLIALTDLEGNYEMVGKAHEILGYEIEDLIGKNVMDFVHPEDASYVAGEFTEFVRSGDRRTVEYRYKRIDGRYLWFATTGAVLKDENGSPEQILFNTRDITERKRAEAEIRRQLSEKETLLREVHHRIKNSISQVEGLLSLQASSTDNAPAKTALQDAISRVGSIRILYEKLLIAKEHEDVSAKDYAESLIDSLVAVFSDRKNVTLEKRISDFTLGSKTAIPLGIIINELLTNVFKYAFKDRDEGRVVIELLKTDDLVTLTIHDNGVGIHERGAADKSPGFGLTIVKMLAEQLGGTYTVENFNGTKSVLSFTCSPPA